MDLERLKQTDVWNLYEECLNYARMINLFSEVDRNDRFYNGNQWEGVKLKGVEPVQLNFIKPIVKYKAGTITQNLLSINYSANNFENKDFRDVAKKTCELLNQRADKTWELNKMDDKIRKVVKKAAINSEGIAYITYDDEQSNPIVELLSKTDIFYGNENDPDIQTQPYILIKQRKPIIELREIARKEEVPEEEIKLIVGDNFNFEEAGDSAKLEKDKMCTMVTKMWKENGEVYFSKATRYCEIKKTANSGLSLYPVAHFLWEEKEGSARGEGEVKYLIPNQIEVNKTEMRRILTVKNTAYPQKIYNKDKIVNPEAIDRVGASISVKGLETDDVKKAFTTTNPVQMSTDVEKLLNDLISTTRELANASDVASGNIDNTTLQNASGRAILAVQQAATQSMNEQEAGIKSFCEDIARIWLEFWKVYNDNGLILEDKEIDQRTGEEIITPVEVSADILEQLQATVKIDITPRSSFDRYAQEQSYENLLLQKLITLEEFVELIPFDTVWDKPALQEMIKKRKEQQKKISEIQSQAELLQAEANKYIGTQQDIEMIEQQGQNLINQAMPS